MTLVQSCFAAVFLLANIFLVFLGTQYLVRSRGLGAILWRSDQKHRWVGLIWAALAFKTVLELVIGRDRSTAEIVIEILQVPMLIGLAVVFYFGHRVIVYKLGIVSGPVVLRWSEVTGWTWGPKGTLILWSDSPWTRVVRLRLDQPIETQIERTPELEECLRQHVPEKQLTDARLGA